MAIALKLLSGLYGAAVSVRNLAFDLGFLREQSVSVPVICVGNVTAGGTGKTPLVRSIVKLLLDGGSKPGILLRGYQGSYTGVRTVEMGDGPELVGDEAVLHRSWFEKEVTIVVSRRRVAGAGRLHQLGMTHIVMDDGFQHRALKRDLNLLLLDISSEEKIDEWSNGKLLPEGRLRERLGNALKRADAVVYVNKGSGRADTSADERLKDYPGPKFTFHLKLEPPTEVVSGDKVVAVCAIGSPQTFFKGLRAAGLNLVEQFAYPDHYSFREGDVRKLISLGFPIICTEKDAVKLKLFNEISKKLIVARQTGAFDDERQRQEFQMLIERRCKRADSK